MPRKARIEYAGAIYHVMDRGDRREAIYQNDEDRLLFLKTLGQACERTGWRVHSYVLMGNHYHLLLETPEANLCAGMRWLQGVYTIRHNARHKLRGHLFQGRYKAVLVEGGDDTYFQTVSDYIHLNPIRAGLLREDKMLADYPWSSFPYFVGEPQNRPPWLCADWVLCARGGKDNAKGRRIYREDIEKRAAAERGDGAMDREMLKTLRRDWCFGSQEFRQRILEQMVGEGRKATGPILVAHNEEAALQLIASGLKTLGLADVDMKTLAKNDPRKIAVATVVKKQTIVGNKWIGRVLEMGVPSRVSRYCSEAEARPEILELIRQVQMSTSKD